MNEYMAEMFKCVLAVAFQSSNTSASIYRPFFRKVRADFGLLVLYLMGKVLFVVYGEIIEGDSKELLEFSVTRFKLALSSYHFLCLLEILVCRGELF